MKKNHKILIRVGLFNAVFIAIVLLLNSFLQPVWLAWNNYYTVNGFYEEPENSIETVFIGASIVCRAIIPTELYEDYGICAYNLGMENQPMQITNYWTQEAYRLHPESLKTVVVDISGIRSGAPEAFYHKAYDEMKFSKVKWNAVKDYTQGDLKAMMSYIFPLVSYHSRWDSLTADDFLKYKEDPVNGTRGYHFVEKRYLEGSVEQAHLMDTELDETAGSDELRDNALGYLDDLVTFCQERDIEVVFIKTATTRWSSGLHNEAAKLAEKYGVDFLDFNYEPYFSEIDFAHAFDTTDANHLNYNGATKFTKYIGQYLVDNCRVTDVRGNEDYLHMEEQLEEYHARIGQQIELQETETVEKYIETAIQEDNDVIISVKGDAAGSLLDTQRDAFEKMGLTKLAEIEEKDSYIAVIENGKIIYEERKQKGDALSYKFKLSKGVFSEIKSGGKDQGNISSVLINDEECSENETGLNILVYSDAIEGIVDSTVFRTNEEAYRQTYKVDTVTTMKEDLDSSKYAYNTLYYNVARYLERMEDAKGKTSLGEEGTENKLTSFIEEHWNDESKIILMAVNEDASETLTKDERKVFESYGLSELSKIEAGDSYAAYIEGGNIKSEVRKSGTEPAVIRDFGIEIDSEGLYTGSSCMIRINGIDYAKDSKGLNVVVFDKEKNCVVDQENF